MSYDEDDAARDAFYDQISNEAIDEFTEDRLRSYYGEHFMTMQPALRSLHEATRLLQNDHVAASTVFAAASVELFLKNAILKPLVYGLVHHENMADVIVKYALGQTGYSRYADLLKNLFREVADLDITTVKRNGSRKPLLKECQELAKRRNDILHSGETTNRQDAELSIEVAQAVYWLFVAPMLNALNFFIFDDGVISPSEYFRPVGTVTGENGVRYTAADIDLQNHPILAGATIPVPPEPI